MAADMNGFDPFPSPTRYPGRDFWPGDITKWVASDSRWLEPDWTPVIPKGGGPTRGN